MQRKSAQVTLALFHDFYVCVFTFRHILDIKFT